MKQKFFFAVTGNKQVSEFKIQIKQIIVNPLYNIDNIHRDGNERSLKDDQP